MTDPHATRAKFRPLPALIFMTRQLQSALAIAYTDRIMMVA
jgi:hypothetical protein